MTQASLPTGAFVPTLAELVALRGRITHGLHNRFARLAAAPGAHRSAHLGRGMEFAGVRPYQPGDDVRSLDWRHTARHGRPYTKLFHEERECPVLVLADQGPSMRFGSRVTFKSVAGARAAALLAWAAVEAGDRVGGAVRDALLGLHVVRPEARERGALALARQLAIEPSRGQALAPGLLEPLQGLARLARPGTFVAIVSDFCTLDEAAEQELVRLARHASIALVQVFDALEAEPPPAGLYRVSDGRRDEILDLRTDEARAAYGKPFRDRRARLAAISRRTGAPLIELATHDDPLRALSALFGWYPMAETERAG